MNSIFHTTIALLSLTIGYRYGGSLFILGISPYLIYMVLQCDARFFPALVLHCASETSATSVIFSSFIILSIYRYKKIFNLKMKTLFWILTGLLPVFIWLTFESIIKLSMYPPIAIAQNGYYLSFFAFFYGTLVSNSFNKKVLRETYAILIIVYLLYFIGVIEFTRIVSGFTFLFSSFFALFFVFKTKKIFLFPISLFAFLSTINSSDESTLTNIFIAFASFIMVILYFKDKNKIILNSTGIIPFLIILILYFYGIKNYMNIEGVYSHEGKDFSNWNSLSKWITWKFFADRAPYWAGGVSQIFEFKHLFPIPGMPNIVATFISGNEREITFGSHTTMIELIRKYGIIPGTLLVSSLIHMVIVSRKIMSQKDLPATIVPLFSMAIISTIVLTLNGQFQILPGYSLLSLGILGIAYGAHMRKYLKLT